MRRRAIQRGAAFLIALVAGVAGCAASGPRPAAAATLQKIKVTQPVDALSMMPMSVARANQYFQAEAIGLEVIVTGGDGPDVHALLAKGVEFASTGPHHLFTTYLEGKPLLGVANLLGRCVINFVIHKDVARDRGITERTPLPEKLRALKGLTIGATRPGP